MLKRPTVFRCPADLREILEIRAVAAHRSLSAEIVHTLEADVERQSAAMRELASQPDR